MSRVRLVTLTPVHVGSGQKLIRNFDFVIEGSKIGFIGFEKLVRILGMEQIGQLTAAMESGRSAIDFLKQVKNQSNIALEDFCDHVANYSAINSKTNELKEHYRTTIKGVCIPGSSLKGAMKTAIWENLATEGEQSHWRPSDYGRVERDKLTKFYSTRIDEKLFGPDPNTKTTRFLKLGDIHFSDLVTSVYEIGIYNKVYRDWKFKAGQSFLAECIPSNSTAYFDFILDKNWLNRNKQYYPEKWTNLFTDFISKGYSEICMLVNDYTSRQLHSEINELQNEGFGTNAPGSDMLKDLKRIRDLVDKAIDENSPTMIIRVGGNNGWNFMTGGWVRLASEEVIRSDDFMSMRRKIQRDKTYDMDLWPKTRKMIITGAPMGFVQITTVE